MVWGFKSCNFVYSANTRPIPDQIHFQPRFPLSDLFQKFQIYLYIKTLEINLHVFEYVKKGLEFKINKLEKIISKAKH